jgi:hypothetical protein
MPSPLQAIINFVANLILDRPARKQSWQELASQLEESGRAVDARAVAAKDPTQAQKTLRHITGIERWGQRRLRVFLGEPFVQDEYNAYRPAANLTTEQQRQEFDATRTQTITLVQQIAAAKSVVQAKVVHNSFGAISAKAWVKYLETHARLESKKIRQR